MVENPNVTGPPPGNGFSLLRSAEDPLGNEPAAQGPSLGLAMVETVVKPGGLPPAVRKISRWDLERLETGESPGLSPAQWSERAPEETEHPSWSTMVSDGRKRKAVPENSAHRFTTKSLAVKPQARHARKKSGITGTAVINNEELSTVKTKMVSVFAMKFKMDLHSDTLRLFLQGKMNREVKCRKIETPHSRFSSFCVTAEWNNWKEMNDPQFWPDGSVVRQYFEPRRPRGATGGAILPERSAGGISCPAASEGLSGPGAGVSGSVGESMEKPKVTLSPNGNDTDS